MMVGATKKPTADPTITATRLMAIRRRSSSRCSTSDMTLSSPAPAGRGALGVAGRGADVPDVPGIGPRAGMTISPLTARVGP